MKEYDPEQMRKLQHLKVKEEVICEAGGFEEDHGSIEGVGEPEGVVKERQSDLS